MAVTEATFVPTLFPSGRRYRPVRNLTGRLDAPPPSGDNIQTRSRVLAVDDFGRSTLIEYDNDLYRSDDDICVENRFATPNTAFPRVLSALTSRRFLVCGGQDITVGGDGQAKGIVELTIG